jgi:hypothetical protein
MEGEAVSRRDYLAVLRMLVNRATPEDIELAKQIPGHWLNRARLEIEAGVASDARDD